MDEAGVDAHNHVQPTQPSPCTANLGPTLPRPLNAKPLQLQCQSTPTSKTSPSKADYIEPNRGQNFTSEFSQLNPSTRSNSLMTMMSQTVSRVGLGLGWDVVRDFGV